MASGDKEKYRANDVAQHQLPQSDKFVQEDEKGKMEVLLSNTELLNKVFIYNGSIVDENLIGKGAINAIVNPANRRLRATGAVCAAIFSAAGYDKLTQACKEITSKSNDAYGRIPSGQTVATKPFALKGLKYILHTVSSSLVNPYCINCHLEAS